MNWDQFQIDLNEVLRQSAQRREEFERQETERRHREIRMVLGKYQVSTDRDFPHPRHDQP